jgi:hypothetical protein
MSDKHLFSAVCIAIEAGIPVLWWGAPGIGKTFRIRGYGEATKRLTEVVIASIHPPEDFSGLPVRDGDRARYLPPEWAVRLVEAGGGLLFFDEISTAAPASQAALLRVVLERAVGQLQLPEAVSIVAAANPVEQASGGWDLSHPLANRFLHIESSADPSAYVTGMLSGFPIPEPLHLPSAWKSHIPTERAKVAAFIKARPQLLLVVPSDAGKASRGWPSPRSWDALARALAASKAIGAPEDVRLPLAGGAVGDAAAHEYLVWERELDLPDPETLLANPSKFELPKRGDKAFAILSSVAAAAVSNLTEKRWCAAWEIIERCCKAGAKDMAARAAIVLANERSKVPDYPVPAKALAELEPILAAARGGK